MSSQPTKLKENKAQNEQKNSCYKMTEHSRIARENRKLATNINVPPVDENLYISSLKTEISLMILDLDYLTTKIAKQRNLIFLLDVAV